MVAKRPGPHSMMLKYTSSSRSLGTEASSPNVHRAQPRLQGGLHPGQYPGARRLFAQPRMDSPHARGELEDEQQEDDTASLEGAAREGHEARASLAAGGARFKRGGGSAQLPPRGSGVYRVAQ